MAESDCSSQRAKVENNEGADPFKIIACKERGMQLFPHVLTSNQHPNLGPFCCITLP